MGFRNPLTVPDATPETAGVIQLSGKPADVLHGDGTWSADVDGLAPVHKTANYAAQASDCVLVDATAGPVTITVPVTGQTAVKKTDASANAVTVAPAAGTIDGAPSIALAAQNDAVLVQGDGNNAFTL